MGTVALRYAMVPSGAILVTNGPLFSSNLGGVFFFSLFFFFSLSYDYLNFAPSLRGS